MTKKTNSARQTPNQLFIRPDVFANFPELIAAQSTRLGGLSSPPFSSLNLGLFTDDHSACVLENRARFFSALQIESEQLAHSYQVHGDQILEVREAGAYEGYDALITNRPNLFCAVTVADCTPILVYDPQNQAVAAIHAGWRGAVQKIVGKTLTTMQKIYGTQGLFCRAYVGACIDEHAYEVGEEVAAHFANRHKKFDAQRQKYFVDLKRNAKDQLLAFGLPENQVAVSTYCTYRHNDRFFSHRKEKGRTGRMLAAIGRRVDNETVKK